jgi:RNA polymerase I-specific transcription initiation factor RRN7
MILTDADGQTVCRDLWALHLSLLPDPPPAEPYHHADQDVAAVRGDPEEAEKPAASLSMKSERFSQLDSDQEAGSGDESDRNGEQEERKHGSNNEDEEDSELEALMRENSELSTSSDENEKWDKPLRKGKAKGRPTQEGPVSTIAVLVLGCWTLRIPVMYQDFVR